MPTDYAGAQQLIADALKKFPTLGPFGFPSKPLDRATRSGWTTEITFSTPSVVEAVGRCADWLLLNSLLGSPTRRLKRSNSYHWKHAVEEWRIAIGDDDSYVPNGAFIAAAVGLGWGVKSVGPNAMLIEHPYEGYHAGQPVH